VLLDAVGWGAAFGAAVYAGGASDEGLEKGVIGAAGGLLGDVLVNMMVLGFRGLPGRLVGCAVYFACGCEGWGVLLLLADCLFLDSECLSEPKRLLL